MSIQEGLPKIILYRSPDPDAEPAGSEVIDGQRMTAQPYKAYYPPLDPQTAYIPANALTLEDITQIVQRDMDLLGLDRALMYPEPRVIETHSFYRQDIEKPLAPGWGQIDWPLAFEGIPLIIDIGDNWVSRMAIDMTIRGRDLYRTGFAMLNREETVAEDVPLCGFDRVIGTLEAEIEAGRLREVFEIRLGYAPYQEDGVPEDIRALPRARRSYYLKPVWTAQVIWGKSAQASTGELVYGDEPGYRDPRNSAYQEYIIIDAQTGDMVRLPGSQARFEDSYYRGFLSWEDVGGRPGQ